MHKIIIEPILNWDIRILTPLILKSILKYVYYIEFVFFVYLD